MTHTSSARARIAEPAELDAFLAANPDISAVQIMITDPSGVLRGKSVRRAELARIYESGRQVAGSILGLDITGEDVDETGLVWDTGDADMCARPIAGTLARTPWLTAPTGQLLLTMFDGRGEPAPADPRHALARAVDGLTRRGLTPVLACEIEFYLLREEQGGRLVPAGGGRASECRKIDAYSLQRLDDLAPLFADVYAAAEAQGLPAETLMSEYAPGQFEITLRHRADALRAVDEAVMFKRLLRGVAQKHGLIACFMAKPFTARAGSGLHLHVSLDDAAGRNMFADEDPAGTPRLRQALAGMKAHMAESMAIFAPNANSYRRFVSRSYAPIAPIWGINNRSVSLRVPAGPPSSRHIEHRIAGADANLYLSAACVLAAAADGIERQLDPGPPVEGNGYAQPGERTLPVGWREALAAAEGSAFLRDALGADFMKIFLAIKRQECERFLSEVSELDYAWYLRT
jgi:glutamine synthetase